MNTKATTGEQDTWTVLSLLNWSSRHLHEKGFESPRLNVELLLGKVLKCQRIQLYLNYDRPLSAEELSEFKSYLVRRRNHEPLQYIVGESEFMGFHFAVDPRVLIPRPETEILVEHVVALAKSSSPSVERALDIGTGCGNIGVSLARFLPGIEIDAIDVSAEALEVAGVNVRKNNVETQVRLVQCDFLTQCEMLPRGSYDIIVSNPPYISIGEFEKTAPEVRNFEPRIATTDGGDGLSFFKAIASKGRELIRSGGYVAVEMAYNQSASVREIFENAGFRKGEIVPDYSGIERVLISQWE